MLRPNPALTHTVFQKAQTGSAPDGAMTLKGTVHKTFFLTILLAVSTFWSLHAIDSRSDAQSLLNFEWMVPLALSLVIGFVPRTAPLLSPIYAVSKGVLMGLLSLSFERSFDGILLISFTLTFCILFALLAAYRSGLIRMHLQTEKAVADPKGQALTGTPISTLLRDSSNLQLGVAAATGGIALFSVLSFVLRFWNIEILDAFRGGWVGIAFFALVVTFAAVCLVIDLSFIEDACEARAPKFMEWYAAFGLLVTLVWLYWKMVRFLFLLRSSIRRLSRSGTFREESKRWKDQA